MAVRVIKETEPELLRYGIESCVRCEEPTLYWWANGCMPLCELCATKVTRDWCIAYATEHKYGPLPSTQYRKASKQRRGDHAS